MNPIQKALAQADKITAANRELEQLSRPTRRSVLYVDETMQRPNGQFVPSLITEDEPGHAPMMGRGEFARPMYVGTTIEQAKATVEEHNRRLGYTPDQAHEVVASSMRASNL